MPGHDPESDYDVIWQGRIIGRVWRYEYKNHPWYKEPPWHWRWSDVKGRMDRAGHSPTLEAAMADFRKAWGRARL